MNRGLSAKIRRMRMLVRCAWDLLRGRRVWWMLSDEGWVYISGDFEE